jgi:hypothetical protein
MEECSYCEASFDDERAYLDHLGDAHEGELSTIDKRRVSSAAGDDGSGFPTGIAVIGLVVAAAVALVVYLTVFAGSGGAAIPNEGDPAVLSDVTTEPAAGAQHVEPGTDIDYDTVPPTGGTHYGTTVSAGFYGEPQSYGALVHSLEHGAVIVYYDESALTEEAESDLRRYANTHTDPWQSFIAVPNPAADPAADFVLTAWEHRLTMDTYDGETVKEFTGEYLGRGPENPVR